MKKYCCNIGAILAAKKKRILTSRAKVIEFLKQVGDKSQWQMILNGLYMTGVVRKNNRREVVKITRYSLYVRCLKEILGE